MKKLLKKIDKELIPYELGKDTRGVLFEPLRDVLNDIKRVKRK